MPVDDGPTASDTEQSADRPAGDGPAAAPAAPAADEDQAGRFTKPLPLFPLLLLAVVAYLIARRPQTNAGGWVLRGAMIALALLWLGYWWLTRDLATDPKDAADDIVRMQKALYAQQHDYRAVRPSDFPDVDVSFYDATRKTFEREQFRFLGDIEDVTATREFPKMRTFLRLMVGDSGTIQLACYHLKMRGFLRLLQIVGALPKNVKTVDLETEMSDGSFIVTANAEGVDTTGAVPRVDRHLHPRETPPLELLALHREQIRQACIREPGLMPVRVSTLEELIASQHRLQAIKNAHKASTGYMDAKELRQIAGEDSPAVRELAAEFERRKRQG